MRRRGYVGRKFSGRRRIDAPTPGMPRKHDAWAGVQLQPGVHIEAGQVRPDQRRDAP